MSPALLLRLAVVGALCAAAGVGACATEVVGPAPKEAGGAGGEALGTGGEGGAGGAVAAKRTVLTRNPFGNVAVVDNLLWDGDFEWLSPFSDQYAWLTGPNSFSLSYDLPKQVLGAACRSGLKCIELKKNAIAVGTGVASAGNALEASVYAVVDGDCSEVEVALIGFGDDEPDVALVPGARVDGWCRYAGVSAERKHALALYVHNASAHSIRVDDAVVRPVVPMASKFDLAKRSLSDFTELKRELRRRTKPAPRPRTDRERRLVRELERRRAE